MMVTNNCKWHERGRCSSCNDYVTSWTIRGLNPGRSKISFLSPKRPDLLWDPPSLHSWYLCYLLGYSGRHVTLTTHLHLVPRLRMSGAIPLHPLRLHGKNYLSHDVEVVVAMTCDTQQHHDIRQRCQLLPQTKLELETPENKSDAPPLRQVAR